MVMEESEHPRRTQQQNRAIHKLFNLVAEELNRREQYMVVQIGKRRVKRLWTGEFVKEHIWRPLQRAETGEVSTTKLKTPEPANVYDHMNAFLSTEFGFTVPFPDRFSQAEH